jgi:hypothetical protein
MSDTVPAVSDRAADAIIGFEVSNQAYYDRTLRRPIWPGGASGCTIGIGYDLGYVQPDQMQADWSDYLDGSALATLAAVCGRRGAAGQGAARAAQSVVVPWDAASAVFRSSTLPRYAAETAQAFPGCNALPPDSFGALVSLVYNRGAAMDDDTLDDRRREMRDIRDAIAAGHPENVPQCLRNMERLWPNAAGLRARREAEAVMFEQGMSALPVIS